MFHLCSTTTEPTWSYPKLSFSMSKIWSRSLPMLASVDSIYSIASWLNAKKSFPLWATGRSRHYVLNSKCILSNSFFNLSCLPYMFSWYVDPFSTPKSMNFSWISSTMFLQTASNSYWNFCWSNSKKLLLLLSTVTY